jgi:hypothetical protein
MQAKKVRTTKVVESSNVNPELEEMKKTLAAMQKQLAELGASPKSKSDLVELIPEIQNNARIRVMSLCNGILNLSVDRTRRDAKKYRFGEFGVVIKIPYHDLLDILREESKFLNDGLFIILDRDAVAENGLDDLYTRILDKDKIMAIITGKNDSDAVNFFKATSDAQREIIITLIIDRMAAGQSVDLNLLDRLSKVIGPEYSISERFKEYQSANQPKEK